MESKGHLNSSEFTGSSGPLPGLLSDEVYWRWLSVVLAVDIVVGVFAVGANIVTIIVYLRTGFSDSTNVSLAALAISDCGIAVTTVSMALFLLLPSIMTTYFTNDINMSTSGYPHVILTRISALITMYLSIERYLCVMLPLKIKTMITPRRTFGVMVMIYVGIFVMYPLGFLKYPVGWTFDTERNRTILDVLPVSDPFVVILENIYIIIVATFIPFLTFFAVVLCTILLSLSLQSSKAWRAASTSESSKVAPKQSKETRAVKMVIIIAAVFIAASIPSCIHIIFIMIIPEFSVYGRFYRLFDLLGMVFVGINSINSGVNVIIYYTMSQKFRQGLNGLFSKYNEK